MKWIALPKSAMTPKRRKFCMMTSNAFFADLQKLVPLKAIWMYAFLLRNSRHRWKHKRQQSAILAIHIITVFFCASACFATYFITYRSHSTKAMIKEPKASD